MRDGFENFKSQSESLTEQSSVLLSFPLCPISYWDYTKWVWKINQRDTFVLEITSFQFETLLGEIGAEKSGGLLLWDSFKFVGHIFLERKEERGRTWCLVF